MSKDKRKLVSELVQQILESGKASRADGPASGLYGRMAQMSSTLTQAGTTLAKLDRGIIAGRKPSALQSLLGSLGNSAPPQKRRSWFFAAAKTSMPDARRIEQLLNDAAQDRPRLVLDLEHAAGEGKEDLMCHLPEGASDPVCEPR
jgi:hypothetical protein